MASSVRRFIVVASVVLAALPTALQAQQAGGQPAAAATVPVNPYLRIRPSVPGYSNRSIGLPYVQSYNLPGSFTPISPNYAPVYPNFPSSNQQYVSPGPLPYPLIPPTASPYAPGYPTPYPLPPYNANLYNPAYPMLYPYSGGGINPLLGQGYPYGSATYPYGMPPSAFTPFGAFPIGTGAY